MNHDLTVSRLLWLPLALAACGGGTTTPPIDSGTVVAQDAGVILTGDAGGVADAGPAADAGSGVGRDSGTAVTDSGTVMPPTDGGSSSGSSFHAYIEPSALSVVSGGALTFTAVPVGGVAPYTYDWAFGYVLAPATPTTATGAGPISVTFTSGTGWASDVTLHAVDANGDEWSQHIQVFVSTMSVGGLTPVLSMPAGGTFTVGQGGSAELLASAGAATWLVHTGSLSTNTISSGNSPGWYVSFPFVGTYTGTLIGASSPLKDTGTVTASFTVTPEPSGTLSNGVRIGPLQGVTGCYFCDAYSDNRIAVRMAGSHTGKYVAVFDQKMKAVDRDDSIIAAIYNGSAWSAFVDLDASAGKKVSPVSLGEGNPERQHQFDVDMTPEGDAVAVFMQAATAVPAPVNANAGHVFANVYRGGAWSGPVRLGSEPDNYSNSARDPHVVAWTESAGVTRAMAVWKRFTNSGLDQLVFSTYSSATGSWSVVATVAPATTTTGGYSELKLAASPTGRVFLVWTDATTSKGLRSGVWNGTSWDVPTTSLYVPTSDGPRYDLKAAADGSAILVIGNSGGTTDNAVYSIRHDGAAWQAPVQIGGLTDIDTLIDDSFGTGWKYQSVADIRLAIDASGNALVAWLANINLGSGHAGLIVSSYAPAGGSFKPFVGVTPFATGAYELVWQPASSGPAVELSLALSNGVGLIAYPIAKNSMPAGTFHDQLYSRRYNPTSNQWSARALVDSKVDQKQGHSRAVLESDGSAMVVYENWPAFSVSAGSVMAIKL